MAEGHVKSFSEWMRTLLTVFFARKRLILMVPIIAGLLTALICLILPPIYSGSFSVLIKAPEVDKTTMEAEYRVDMRPGLVMENVISDEFHILQSHALHRSLAEFVLSEIMAKPGSLPGGSLSWFAYLPGWGKSLLGPIVRGSQPDLSKRDDKADVETSVEKLAYEIQRITTVEAYKGSDVIQVNLRHPDQKFLMSLLNAYMQQYYQIRTAIWFEGSAPDLFMEGAGRYLQKWQELSDELIKLKKTFDIVEPTQEKNKLLEEFSVRNAEVTSLRVEIKELEGLLNALLPLAPERAIAFFLKRSENDSLVRELRMRIAQASSERANLLKDFLEKSPVVDKADYQLHDLYVEYKRLITESVHRESNNAKIRIQALTSSLADAKSRLMLLTQYEQKVKMLEENIEMHRKQYIAQGEKAIEIKRQSEFRRATTTIRTISSPSVNPRAVWPQTGLLVMASVMLGFLLTLFFALVRYLMNDSYYLPEDVNRDLGIPILASFPYDK
jgi:uncharacterized protein involved in exopolysaccharide biosynthesis